MSYEAIHSKLDNNCLIFASFRFFLGEMRFQASSKHAVDDIACPSALARIEMSLFPQMSFLSLNREDRYIALGKQTKNTLPTPPGTCLRSTIS